MVLASLFELGESLYEQKKYNETIAFAHVYQFIDLEVQIDLCGNVVNAIRNERKKAMTLIPSTIEGESRSNAKDAPSPLGLHDNLLHIAGDYSEFFGIDNSKHFAMYIRNLTDWYKFGGANKYILSILEYLKRGRLIQDIKCFIKDPGLKDKVRLAVVDSNGSIYQPWLDDKLIINYAEYYHNVLINTANGDRFCYITGRKEDIIRNGLHCFIPNMVFAKLISKDEDKMLLTYKGRLKSSDEVGWIGRYTSLVINYALRWLIKNRSIKIGDIYHIFFDMRLRIDWHILNSTQELMMKYNLENKKDEQLESSIISNIGIGNKLIYFGLGAITIGRLNIYDYRQYKPEEIKHVVRNIVNHHKKYQWRISNDYYCLPESKRFVSTVLDLGTKKSICSENSIKEFTRTHILGLLEDRPLPINYVNKASYNAITYIKGDERNIYWSDKLFAACAIIRGNLFMNDENLINQLYEEDLQIIAGRLLAILHWEDYKLYRYSFRKRYGDSKAKEACNVWQYESMARKRMSDFVMRPYKTWCYLNTHLDNIENKLRSLDIKIQYFINLRARLESILYQNNFSDIVNLDGRVLLGYEIQIYEFLQKPNVKIDNNTTEGNEYEYQEKD